MRIWKITNKVDKDVKITLRVKGTENNAIKVIGLFLKPKHFVLGMPNITAQLDAQSRRGLVEIDENFDNTYFNLEFGKPYEVGEVDQLRKLV